MKILFLFLSIVLMTKQLYAQAQYIDMSRPNNAFSKAEVQKLESRPNSFNVIYININGMVNSEVDRTNAVQAWRMVAEDYRPFEVNITTNYSVYSNTPVKNRMKVDLNSGHNSGLCHLAGFGKGAIQCIATVDNLSHEIGHGLGISHDGGSINSIGDYYQGNDHWGTIMGYVSLGKMGTFNNGDYEGASNKEDDLQIIASHLTFRADDHSNTFLNSSPLVVTRDSVSPIHNTGVIEKSDDKDVFELNFSEKSNVNLWIKPLKYYNNLHVKATIYDADKNVLFTSSPYQHQGNVSSIMQAAKIEGDFEKGIYYLEIENSGYSNDEGFVYSSYGSLGYYEISGYAGVVQARANVDVSTTTCMNSEVVLNNKSLGTDLNYLWTIEGADIKSSTEQSPKVIFLSKGLHKITLTVSNKNSSSTIEKWIEVGITNYEFIVSKKGLLDDLNVTFMNEKIQQAVWEISYEDLKEKDNDYMSTTTCLTGDCYTIKTENIFDYPTCGLYTWSNRRSYKGGDKVSYLGKEYQATQWTTKQPGEGEVTWELIGTCVSDNPLEYFTVNSQGKELTKIFHSEFNGNQVYTKENQCLDVVTTNVEANLEEVNIYPNPVKNILMFNFSISKVNVYDVYGNCIFTNNDMIKSINTEYFEKGIYIISYAFNEKKYYSRIQKN